MANTKAQPFTPRSKWVWGGTGTLADAFPFNKYVFLAGKHISWWLRHPRSLVGVVVFCVLTARDSIVWQASAIITGLMFCMYLLILCAREYPNHRYSTKRSLLLGIYRMFKVKRRWRKATRAAGFPQKPRLSKVRSSPNGVTAHVNVGKVSKTVTNLQSSSDYIAAVLGAHEVATEFISPAEAKLHMIWGDPTARLLTPGQIPQEQASVMQVAFGLDPDGHPVYASLTTSLLIVGESESGKSNGLWSILNGLNTKGIPYRLRVIDPAGGTEFNKLQDSWLTREYTDNVRKVDATVANTKKHLYERLAEMGKRGERSHLPSVDEPLEILIIDELLMLKHHDSDSDLAEIISVGRKANFIVVALSQLSQVDALGRVRDLFPQRICLATKSDDMTNSVLGPNAERDGARCSRIPKSTPGVGYYYSNEQKRFQRFRFPLITDEQTTIIADGGNVTPQKTAPTMRLTKKIPSHNVRRMMKNVSLDNRKTALYKLFDASDTLLYVGIGHNPNTRLADHARTKVWWSEVDQSRTYITWYPKRKFAREQELHSIRTEHPRYNVESVVAN